MANVKTAISIKEALFKEADALARRMHVPRSQFFAMAVEHFIRQHRNRQLLEQINKAYATDPDPAEQALRSKRKSRHRHLVEGQW